MRKRLLQVVGNIGVGKTTLAERLAGRLKYQVAFESVADNPYLRDFYADMNAWAFHLQVYFLLHRAEMHRAMATSPEGGICDRSVYEGRYVFARAVHYLGHLSERDYYIYSKLHQIIEEQLPSPDLLIHLEAPAEVLLARIHARDRPFEQGITLEYLQLLNRLYAEWLEAFDLCQVLVIQADKFDLRVRSHLDAIVEAIERKLEGKELLHLSNS